MNAEIELTPERKFTPGDRVLVLDSWRDDVLDELVYSCTEGEFIREDESGLWVRLVYGYDSLCAKQSVIPDNKHNRETHKEEL